MVGNLQDRHEVHEQTVRVCNDILSRRQAHVQFEMRLRDELQSPIRDVDLVITVGGDGTLLQASHYVDNSIPVLGVNSDPTQADEVRPPDLKLEQIYLGSGNMNGYGFSAFLFSYSTSCGNPTGSDPPFRTLYLPVSFKVCVVSMMYAVCYGADLAKNTTL